jgi:hypothetical protein
MRRASSFGSRSPTRGECPSMSSACLAMLNSWMASARARRRSSSVRRGRFVGGAALMRWSVEARGASAPARAVVDCRRPCAALQGVVVVSRSPGNQPGGRA